MTGDRLHALSDGLGAADIAELRFEAGSDVAESRLEISIVSNGRERSFRFFAPQDLQIGGSFPRVGWLQIFDIRSRQLDGLDVYVADGEQSETIRFYARAVEEII